jgi:hypothetical protein
MTTPALDLLLSGGLSILVIVPLLFVRVGFEQDRLNERLLLASALVNWPHFMASFALLYRSREQVLEHRFASITFPALLLTAGVAVVAASAWTQGPLILASLLTSAYLAWHYTGQAFGMTVAFAHVEGLSLTEDERRPIRLGLRLLLALHVAWIHHLFPAGAIPEAVETAFRLAYEVLLRALPIAAALGAWGLWQYRRRIGRMPPARVLAPWAAIQLWYVLLAVEPGSLILVQLFHALQYLVFPLRVQVNRYASEARARGEVPTRAAQARHVSAYYGLLFASGVFALWALPALLGAAVSGIWGLAVPAAAAGVTVQMIVNVHHYLTDATVWKLRDARVRGALFGHLA